MLYCKESDQRTHSLWIYIQQCAGQTMATLLLIIWRTSIVFSTRAVPFISLNNTVKIPPFSMVSVTFAVFFPFEYRHSQRHDVTFHCALSFPFPDDYDFEHFWLVIIIIIINIFLFAFYYSQSHLLV